MAKKCREKGARRRVCFGVEAREALRRGFNLLAEAMIVTLGPAGRMVVVEQSVAKRPPECLNNGAVIARRFTGLPHRFETMGALLARHIAWQVREEVGDGSTTAVMIAKAVLNEATRYIVAGYDPVPLRSGLEKGLAVVMDELTKLARPLDKAEQIISLATAITGQAELGRYIEEIFDMVGPHGAVEVRSSYSQNHDREYIRGVFWNQGWVSAYFATEGDKAVLQNPYLLFTNRRLQKATELLPLMEKIRREERRGLVVIAHTIEGDALNILVTNKARQVMPTLGIRTPGLGSERFEILKDLAILCGGKVLVEEAGEMVERASLADLGQADEVRAIRSGFTISGGKGRPAAIRERIQEIRRLIPTVGPGRERDRLAERAGKLLGGVALLYVGGATEAEREYLKGQAQDAVRIVRLGLHEGIVPGGGAAFLACLPALARLQLPPAEAVAIPILQAALLAPMQTIIQNAGFEAAPIIAQVRQQGVGQGFDVERSQITEMIAANIVDPVKVLQVALRTAISGAVMALTTEALVHKPRFNRDREVELKP